MMKVMRSQMRNVLKITLILVIPSFVLFYGWGSSSNRRAQEDMQSSLTFVEVKSPSGFGTTKIGVHEMQRAKRELMMDIARQLGGQDVSRLENAFSNRQVAEEAVNLEVLRQLAKDRGIEVTKDELTQYISQMFPGYSAQQIVKAVSSQMDFRTWIAQQRDSYKIAKARMLVEAPAHVTLNELWSEYSLEKSKIGMEYARLDAQTYAEKATASDQEIVKEYEARQQELEVPDRAVYRYVSLNRSDFLRQAQVPEDAVKAEYEKIKGEKYRKPEGARIRQVLIAATAEEAEAKRKQIDDIYAKSQQGTPLSALADEFSEDPQNAKFTEEKDAPPVKLGGLLSNPITKDMEEAWGKEYVQAAFSLPVDEVSKPILTPRGWVIMQVVSREAESYTPYEQARPEVERLLRQAKVDELLEQKRAVFEEARRTQTTLDAIARTVQSDVRETSPVQVGASFIPGIGSVSDYMSDMSELKPDSEPTQVIGTGQGYAVVQMKTLIPKHVPPMDEVKKRLADDIKNRKGLAEAVKMAQELVQRVKAGDSLSSAGVEMKASVGKTAEPFLMEEAGYPYNQIRDLASWIKRTPVGDTFIASGVKYGDLPRSVFVCKILARESPTREKFIEDMKQLEVARLMARRQTVLQEYLSDARRSLKPRFNPELVTD